MKRDMDLVRNLLLEIEEWDDSPGERTLGKRNEGISEQKIYDHLEIMAEAGLIIGMRTAGAYYPDRITWNGYDFLDAVRNESTWQRTQDKIKSSFGTLPFDMVKAVAIEIAKAEMKKHFPGMM
jgi:Hypothetical protein (DUF2513)